MLLKWILKFVLFWARGVLSIMLKVVPKIDLFDAVLSGKNYVQGMVILCIAEFF